MIDLTSAIARNLRLDGNRDYRLVLPKGAPASGPRGLRIVGGRSVVIVGGTVNVPDKSGAGELEDPM